MNARAWSFVLQWSRVGIGAFLFLIAARFLTLTEIGLFATAFASIRLTQGIHKAGVAETAILFAHRPERLGALFLLSVTIGLGLALSFVTLGWVFSQPMLMGLSVLPLINGFSAVSDGLLRRRLEFRALALRSLVSQSAAASLALWLLFEGAGAWALVAFAGLNGILSGCLTLILAKWYPANWPQWKYRSLIWPKFAHIALRDLVSSAQFPVVQLAVAVSLGLPAAGAFQIATRILSLIDALAISPLRFIALPQLSRSFGSRFEGAFNAQMRRTAALSCWIWGGVVATAPTFAELAIGPEHATEVSPILQALAIFGLTGALVMPVNQALTAAGHTGLVLERAARLLAAGLIFAVPALLVSPFWVSAALSLAAVITNRWYIWKAGALLPISWSNQRKVTQFMAAGTCMACTLMLIQNVITSFSPAVDMLRDVVFGTLIYAVVVLALSRHSRSEAAA